MHIFELDFRTYEKPPQLEELKRSKNLTMKYSQEQKAKEHANSTSAEPT